MLAKLIIPSIAVLLLAGGAGGLLITRELSGRAETTLNQSLLQASLRARALLQNRELYVLESATLAANLQGMAQVLEARDVSGTARLLDSVLALKTDLNVVTVLRSDGMSLVEFRRERAASPAVRAPRTDWSGSGPVRDAFRSRIGERAAGIVNVGRREILAVAGPVCPAGSSCRPVGVVVAGVWLDELASALAGPASRSAASTVALYDRAGTLLAASSDTAPPRADPRPGTSALIRRTQRVAGIEVATLYAPLEIAGQSQGSLAVSLPTEPIVAPLRGTGIQLGLVLVAALAGLILIGIAVSRSALAQVRPLLKSSRSLGRGELSARAPVLGNDELGELARRFNEMAEQLQASHENLENLVGQRTEEIQRLLRGRTDFFASISHELRTPLAVILSRVKMMLNPMYRRASRDRHEALHTIKQSGEELLTLVNEILELARAEAGRIEVNIEVVSVSDLLREMNDTIEGLASARDISVGGRTPMDLPPVHADPRRLREIVLNLVDNAVKYTPAGGRIKIDAEHIDGAVEIRVSDSGVGIPGDIGDRVFEPFYRAPGVQTQHGEAASGLGLALAKRLVEAQGGTIAYEARAEGGSIFTVRLSAALLADQPERPDPTRRRVRST